MKRAIAVLATATALACVAPAAAYAYSSSASNQRAAAGGTLRASFTDTWQGAGISTWTLDTSRSSASWTFVGPTAPGSVRMSVRDTICFSKYGLGDISLGGPSLTQVGNCGTDDTSAQTDSRSVTNNLDRTVGRGNNYGRWLWVSHSAAGKLTYYSSGYTVEAYRRTSPIGGTV